MKKLLYLVNHRFPTEKGYGIQIAKMAEAFGNAGLAVTLVTPTRKGESFGDLYSYYHVARTFEVKIIPAPDFYLPGVWDRFSFVFKHILSARKLARYARKHDADVIYSRDEWSLYFLARSRRQLVYEAHSFSPKRMFIYRRLLSTRVKVIAITGHLAAEFRRMGFPHDRVLVAADGVNIKEFDVDVSKEEARMRVSLPNDKPVALYVGFLYDWKGVSIIGQAAAALPDVRFVVVGGEGTDPGVTYVGRKPYGELPLYLKTADILLLPNSASKAISRLYTSPLKLFQYMAARRPIVASDLPSLREILNEHNSVLVASDDARALSEGIKRLMNNKELADRVAAQAFADVQEHTWASRARRILAVI